MPIRVLALPLAMMIWGPGAGPVASPLAGPLRAPASPEGSWAWPVTGPVIRGFDPPETPYGPGHRGIDIAVVIGTVIVAPEAGTVSFAGPVGGQLFLTLDHGSELESTYSWLSSTLVRRGDVVARGQPIATTGLGHPGSSLPHLHLGAKRSGVYVDPLELLSPLGVADLIRLAPLAA